MRIFFDTTAMAAWRTWKQLPNIQGVLPTTERRIVDMVPSQNLSGNRGNLIHGEAPAKIFEKDHASSCFGHLPSLRKWNEAKYAARVTQQFDAIVLSFANIIRPGYDGAPHYEALKGLHKGTKVIALGAGIQGEFTVSDLPEGTRNLLSWLSENAEVFGVRGETTKAWLDENGFPNSMVLGCPSLFVYPRSILGLSYDNVRATGGDSKVITAGHLAAPLMMPKAKSRRAHDYLDALAGIPASYIFQDEIFWYSREFMERDNMYNEGTSELDPELVAEYYREAFGLEVPFKRYYYFNDTGSWRQAGLRHDLYIGDRFHGGVAVLQAGVPAIFLKADNRVGELTGYFDVPNMTIDEFKEAGLAGAIESCLTDEALERMKATYRRNYRKFVDTMSGAGLTVANELTFAEPATQDAPTDLTTSVND